MAFFVHILLWKVLVLAVKLVKEIEMLETILKAHKAVKHAVRVAHSQLREHAKRGSAVAHLLTGAGRRSSRWPKVEHAYKSAHATCAACGTLDHVQVHHKQPFHLKPELELDPENLISLCMSKYECHIRLGHGDDFKAYNPHVESDVAIVLANPSMRSEYEAKAKANRLYVDGGAG